MSQKTPTPYSGSTFPSSASSYKRRSLQSPFILNDLTGDTSNDNSDNNNDNEQESIYENHNNNMNSSIDNETHNDSDDDIIIHRRASNTTDTHYASSLNSTDKTFDNPPMNYNTINNGSPIKSVYSQPINSPRIANKHNRYSMQIPEGLTIMGSNPSISTSSTRKHSRSRSTASTNYIPLSMPPAKSSTFTGTPPMLNGSFSNTNSPSHSPAHKPFQFNSMLMNNSSENLTLPQQLPQQSQQSQVLPKPSYRRGHRYKHSSVSMNMFQDPQRLSSTSKPHNLPQKYPIPTTKEVISMITPPQKKKLLICFIQSSFVLFAYILGFRYSNSCLLTLSHILFYDIISNISAVIVQIMSNFEVWRISSLKFPFGLGRIEVLIGFALSVSLLFVGLDLFSHIVEELLINTLTNKGTEDKSHNARSHGHSHGNGDVHLNSDGTINQIYPVLYELLILSLVIITLITAHFVNDRSSMKNKEAETNSVSTKMGNDYRSTTTPNFKRISSITLKEPKREGIITRIFKYANSKFGIRQQVFHSSTTSLSLLYACYCLYYPFAQGIIRLGIGHGHANGEGHGHDVEYEHALLEEDLHEALEATEWINNVSTVVMAVLVSIVAWRLIRRLGNILLLASPSVEIGNNKNTVDNSLDVERLIEQNVRQLDVYKSSYNISEIKIARLNTRVYVIIMRVDMPGASDDDEAKFRFYSMRIIRGIMYQAKNGELGGKNATKSNNEDERDDVNNEEANRRSLIDLLNLSTSIEDVEGIDSSGDQFEITIDISRL